MASFFSIWKCLFGCFRHKGSNRDGIRQTVGRKVMDYGQKYIVVKACGWHICPLVEQTIARSVLLVPV